MKDCELIEETFNCQRITKIKEFNDLEMRELSEISEFNHQKLSDLEIQEFYKTKEFDTQKLSELEKEFHGDILKILKVTS